MLCTCQDTFHDVIYLMVSLETQIILITIYVGDILTCITVLCLLNVYIYPRHFRVFYGHFIFAFCHFSLAEILKTFRLPKQG